MFNRTRRMTVSLSFIALFFIDDPSLASATLVSKDGPTLLNLPQMRTALGDQIMLGIASTAPRSYQ